MRLVALIFNLPWSMLGVMCAFISGPRFIIKNTNPLALLINVRSLWWYTWMPSKRGVRAMTHGNVVLLSKKELKGDREHELVHVEQFQRMPLIHPYLYAYESGLNGYKNNKYEVEAYRRAGNPYLEASTAAISKKKKKDRRA